MLVQTAAQEMINARVTLASFRDEMIRLAKMLPAYETVLSMYGVGEITAAQLMAEIGDVTRFPHRSCLIAFAGIDPDVDQSGKHDASSVPTSKRGSPHLRKTLFQIVSAYLKICEILMKIGRNKIALLLFPLPEKILRNIVFGSYVIVSRGKECIMFFFPYFIKRAL